MKYVLEGQEVLGFLIETRVLRTAYDLVYFIEALFQLILCDVSKCWSVVPLCADDRYVNLYQLYSIPTAFLETD